ncbi:putative ubiquitin carboxyl-terminal family 1 [Rosellinia necatrix]|uniref:Ubiquitin carboxyl-terminal hydrolase n=1 Tax=Rosellinia necatrix TaxID=77044 RepID=A0A1W2TNT4_ROSNE|nr:putative ubiquitin carboxyl-terminal family 1 [Rosellinia necatrix]
MVYKKHFIPLESNPGLFTQLIHQLGVSTALCFHDVWSLDDPSLLSLVPRPVLAFIIVFPTSSDYEDRLAKGSDVTVDDALLHRKNKDVIWFKQTINNACGLYGILHAVANGRARDFILPGSHLSHLLEKCASLSPDDCAAVLENDVELESKYTTVAVLGDTEAPENPEDEVDFHYVCFVKSHHGNNLFLLDGDRHGPVDKGLLTEDDLLSRQGISTIKEFIDHHDNTGNFSLLALAPSADPVT